MNRYLFLGIVSLLILGGWCPAQNDDDVFGIKQKPTPSVAPAKAKPNADPDDYRFFQKPEPKPDSKPAAPNAVMVDFDQAGHASAEFEPGTAKPGETVTLRIRVQATPGWRVQPTRKQDAKSPDRASLLRILNSAGLNAGIVKDPGTTGDAIFEQPFDVPNDAPPGPRRVVVSFLPQLINNGSVASRELYLERIVNIEGVSKDKVLVHRPARNSDYDLFPEKIPEIHIRTTPSEPMPGQEFKLSITLKIIPGWHTYPINTTSVQKTVIRLDLPDDIQALGKWDEPVPLVKIENGKQSRVHEGEVTFTQTLKIDPKAPLGLRKLPINMTILVCEKKCLPPRKETIPFELGIGTSSSTASAPAPAATKGEETATEETPTPVAKSGFLDDILPFVLQGILFGLISLVTPCVFPMIPITVSFFIKQSEKSHHHPIKMALVYSGTIVVVLTVGAIFLLGVFQAAIQHWLTNAFMGALFVYFALSLFGMYEIQLPASLAQFTSAQESKGGVYGTMFMALTFTIISFACVAPFLGGFAGLAPPLGDILGMLQKGDGAKLGYLFCKLFLGAFAFSTTFASPFFFLALFPALLKKLPRSGAWMNSVKVVMGFLELAAAIKFFRASELLFSGEAWLLTFDFGLALYVAIFALTGAYLLGFFKLAHDHSDDEHLGTVRLLFAFFFLGLAVYLSPALFSMEGKVKEVSEEAKLSSSEARVRPRGVVYEWLESFLLPDTPPGIGRLRRGIELARQQKQRIFLNFTGVTCTNCKINENSVFSKPNIEKALHKYVVVEQFTDVVPGNIRPATTASWNSNFQVTRFGDLQLPLYVILEPVDEDHVREVARYTEGKINDAEAFLRFLEEGLTKPAGRTLTIPAE